MMVVYEPVGWYVFVRGWFEGCFGDRIVGTQCNWIVPGTEAGWML